jgi:hypothetical protein
VLQFKSPDSALKLPAAHAEHVRELELKKVPAEHAMHLFELSLNTWPSKQHSLMSFRG